MLYKTAFGGALGKGDTMKREDGESMSKVISVTEMFGKDVFNDAVMRDRLPKSVYKKLKKTIEDLCDVLGIITEKKEEVLDSEIEEMIEARQQARKDRNFALADEIRGKLLDMGIVLEDTREGVKWKRA